MKLHHDIKAKLKNSFDKKFGQLKETLQKYVLIFI